MRSLKVTNRYLTWSDGTPFFYLGDTAWEIFHRLNREEADRYLATRARQGFNVIQAVALAEYEGLTVPNMYGRLPLLTSEETNLPDPTKPDLEGEYSYWDHVDYIIRTAAKYDLFVSLLPTWGDKYNLLWGVGPVIFTEENAYTYGKWIAERYKDDWNIIWMLGGDRPLEPEHRAIIDAMAAGIKEVDTTHLITFHPCGTHTSNEYVGDADYIDFHTAQTAHGVERSFDSDGMMREMAAASEKPFMDSEPRYEDHPACFNAEIGYFWNAEDVRQNAYWDILAGACGHTYGNHNIWYMNREPIPYWPFTWEEALEHPGAEQMRYVKELRMKRDYMSLIPAQEILTQNFAGMGHMTAATGDGYAYIYSPLGIPFTMQMGFLGEKSSQIRASWFDPRNGKEQVFAILPNFGDMTFAPPSQGKGCDWVLVLEVV